MVDDLDWVLFVPIEPKTLFLVFDKAVKQDIYIITQTSYHPTGGFIAIYIYIYIIFGI